MIANRLARQKKDRMEMEIERKERAIQREGSEKRIETGAERSGEASESGSESTRLKK